MPTVESRTSYAAQFERHERDRSGDPAWLHERRLAAMSRFERLGFPTNRDEEWRFTSVTPIASRSFETSRGEEEPSRDSLAPFLLRDTPACQLVFVNGRYSSELSSPDGTGVVETRSLAAALRTDPSLLEHHLATLAPYENQAFTALNTAFLGDGAFVRIPADAVVPQPIHLVFVAFGNGPETVSHPRVLVLSGPNSQAALIESYVSPHADVTFTNAVTEIIVGENATLDHYKVLRESMEAFHIAAMQVRLQRNCRFSSHSMTFGGGIVRNEVSAVLDGEGIDCTLNGLYLVDGKRLVDNHTTIDHAKPHCDSHEVYKGIVDGKGRAVFNGKIIVRPDAQKTDAKQTNKALLLSEDGQINTKPQLEIFADDVKCTHGATVGQLDEDALFYLRARGIGAQDARNMLIRAFAGDLLTRVKIDELRGQLEQRLHEQLQPH